MKFGFIVKHRGVWPANWMCEALGVSRGGFYAWLTRPRSAAAVLTRSSVPKCAPASLAATAPMEPGGCGRTLLPKVCSAACIGSSD
jgi:hypothetical protein